MRAQTATIVAHYDAIWIKHGNNFENEAVSEGFRYRVLTKQELKQALHDKRAVALSWMHSAGQDHALSLRYVILRSLKIGYDEHFQIVARQSLAKRSPPYYTWACGLLTDCVCKLKHISEGIWVAHGNVDIIFVML
jgi:hypothetical protein